MPVYLDYAAATPLNSDVLASMKPFFETQFYNPSASYGPAQAVSKALDSARADVASVIGAKPSEIIFTAGGTEANNMTIYGVMNQHSGTNILVSALEHDSVRVPTQNYKHQVASVDSAGLVDVTQLVKMINNQTVLVSIMYANNEVGTIQPIKRIAAQLEQIKRQRITTGNTTPLYFHVDAAQAGNYLDMHVHRLGVDLMTINGGKLYGPKQSGVLFVKSGIVLKPLITGGGQERNLRSGTENVPGAIGFAKALQISAGMKQDESQRMHLLQKSFLDELQTAFPNVIINGSLKHRLPNNIHFTLPGCDNERVLMALDMQDIYAAAGSACSASHDEPSHVLKAMGLEESAIRSSLRISMGRQTTDADISQTIAALKMSV